MSLFSFLGEFGSILVVFLRNVVLGDKGAEGAYLEKGKALAF